MAVKDRIEINSRVMLGKPVVRSTRIPVELILRKLAEGASEEDLLGAYPRPTREDTAQENPGERYEPSSGPVYPQTPIRGELTTGRNAASSPRWTSTP